MSGPDELLEEFKAAYEAGGRPDLASLLDRAAPQERQALRERIDSYLMSTPRRPWDAAAYADSPAREAVERAWESLEGVSGTWPELLPSLRHRARIKRADLVRRLAGALGVAGREEKVAVYYNEMEHGRLPAAGISRRVFEALGEILGESGERLRAAGLGMSPPPAGEEPLFAAYARVATGREGSAAPAPEEGDAAPAVEAAGGTEAEPAPDEVDRLFTGG